MKRLALIVILVATTVEAQDSSIETLQRLVRVEDLLLNALNYENPSSDAPIKNPPSQLSLPRPTPYVPFSIFGSQNRFSNLPTNNNQNTNKVVRSPQSVLDLGLDAIGSTFSDLFFGAYRDAVLRRPSPPSTNIETVSQFLRSRESKPDPAYKSIGTRNQFTDAIDDIDKNSRNPINGLSRFLSLFDGL